MNTDSSLGWKMFFWAMGLLQALSLGVLFYIANRIEGVNSRVDIVSGRVFYLEGLQRINHK